MDNDKDNKIDSVLIEKNANIDITRLKLVPVVREILFDIANEAIVGRGNHGLKIFFLMLETELIEVNKKINGDFVKKKEFKDLAKEVFSKAAITVEEEKLDALKNIFINAITSTSSNYDEAMKIVALIDSWQPIHIIILKILSNPVSFNNSKGNPVSNGGCFSTNINQLIQALLPEWDGDQIDRIWKDLFDEKIHNTLGTRTMMTNKGIYQLENRLTKFGKLVVEYIIR